MIGRTLGRPPRGLAVRKVAFAASLENAIELYDFLIYEFLIYGAAWCELELIERALRPAPRGRALTNPDSQRGGDFPLAVRITAYARRLAYASGSGVRVAVRSPRCSESRARVRRGRHRRCQTREGR